jgi:hypothetical protein
MGWKMEIYLGVASFVYILQDLGKDFSISGKFYIVIWLPDGKHEKFFISAEDRDAENCGFIFTNDKALKELFGVQDSNTIKTMCRKEYNPMTSDLQHCSIRGSDERGNIKINVNNKYSVAMRSFCT